MAETPLLQITDLHIDGQTDLNWLPIVRGIDLTLRPGEVLGLIGESGAGKSTLGLAAMGYVRGGCRISGGSIVFDGQELVGAAGPTLRALRGRRIAYVAQSAAASFNPARRLIDQFTEGPRRTPSSFSRRCNCRTRPPSAFAIPIRSQAGSFSGR